MPLVTTASRPLKFFPEALERPLKRSEESAFAGGYGRLATSGAGGSTTRILLTAASEQDSRGSLSA
jgi:hypothetical protein